MMAINSSNLTRWDNFLAQWAFNGQIKAEKTNGRVVDCNVEWDATVGHFQ